MSEDWWPESSKDSEKLIDSALPIEEEEEPGLDADHWVESSEDTPKMEEDALSSEEEEESSLDVL